LLFPLPKLRVAEDAGVLGGAVRMLSHGGRQVIAQNSGCHSKTRCSSDVRARLLRARRPARIARRIAGKDREELLLEARVQRELRAVPAAAAAALGVLRRVVVEARTAFGRALVSLGPLLVGSVGALRETLVRARRAARVRSLAARLPSLAGRTRQPLRAAVDAATFDEEELLAVLPCADTLVALHPVRAVERHWRRALCALDALGALLESRAARQALAWQTR
jgi:hypothetical protein